MNPFQQLLMGGNPLSALFNAPSSSAPAGGAGAAATGNTLGAVASPTIDDTRRDLMMGRLGQVGALLVAAGQRQTPAQRAALLAQMPHYLDSSQDEAIAQKNKAASIQIANAEQEMRRKQELEGMFTNPDMLKKLNVTPEQAKVLGVEGLQKVYQNILSRDPLATQQALSALKTQGLQQQQLERELSIPKLTPTQQEYERKAADEKAKAEATEANKAYIDKGDYTRAYDNYISAYNKAIEGNALGPYQANRTFRNWIGSAGTPQEALRKNLEAAELPFLYGFLQRQYGALDPRGITDAELNMARKNLLSLDATDPQGLLDQFKKMNMPNWRRNAPSGGSELEAAKAAIQRGANRDAVIKRLQEHGIKPEGL